MENEKIVLEMQYPSKNELLNYLSYHLCQWGLKFSDYNPEKHIRGSPTPLWVNPSPLFYKILYISNCSFSFIFLGFFIIATLINNSYEPKSLTDNFDLYSNLTKSVIVNYYLQLNLTDVEKSQATKNYVLTLDYITERQKIYPNLELINKFYDNITCANIVLKYNTTDNYYVLRTNLSETTLRFLQAENITVEQKNSTENTTIAISNSSNSLSTSNNNVNTSNQSNSSNNQPQIIDPAKQKTQNEIVYTIIYTKPELEICANLKDSKK